jgi:hypothetical protein
MRRHVVTLAAALAWLVSIEGAQAKLDILVDKATQRMMVMQDGYIRYMWPVSTGRDETATPNGVYTPQRLERNWFSTAYYNSPMPYSIFFHNGYAIHGSYAIDRLGGPASHGCVRLHPHHAALLFDLVQQEGPAQTTIEVTDQAGPGVFPPGREVAGGRGAYGPGYPPVAPGYPPAASGYPPAASAASGYPSVAPGYAPGGSGYPAEPRVNRYRDPGDMPELGPMQRDNRPFAAANGMAPRPQMSPPQQMAWTDQARPDDLPPRRETGGGRGWNLPEPKVIRYRDPADTPEPPSIVRNNRPVAASNAVAQKPLPAPPLMAPPPSSRRVLVNEVKPAAAPARPPCETDGSSPDCRTKPKVAQVAPAPSAPPAQAASSAASSAPFKLLPASCWSGGASRWRGVSCK